MFDGINGMVRQAYDWLRTNPRVAIPAVLSLSVGFGGTAVLFSVAYAALFRPLAYADPDRLVTLRLYQPSTGSLVRTTTADFNDWEDRTTAFEKMGLFLPVTQMITVVGGEFPERIRYQYVTASIFPLLGVGPQLGRTFNGTAATVSPVILSDAFWRRRFNADPNVIGTTIQLAGTPFEVVGVMPRGFRVTDVETDVWRETYPRSPLLNERKVRWLVGAARLKREVTLQQAQAEMTNVAAYLAEEYPESNRGWSVLVEPMSGWDKERRERRLYPLFGVVAFVLLIACVNVTGLLIANAVGRSKELATRAALGASRGRLARELIAEFVGLALVSGVVALLVARWGLDLLTAYPPQNYDFVQLSSMGMPVLLFVMGVSLVVGVVIGGIVAFRASGPDLNGMLKQSAGGVTDAGRTPVLTFVATAELALAFVLLVGAGLLIRTMANVNKVPVGFDTSNVLVAEIDVAGPRYRGPAFRRELAMVTVQPEVETFFRRVIQDASALPGIDSAAIASWLPGGGGAGRRTRTFLISDRPAPERPQRPTALYTTISPDFFKTLRMPLVRGRAITDADTQLQPWVVVINRAAAERYWPGEDPIGKLITLDTVPEEQPRRIVGIVENSRQFTDPSRAPWPEVYAAAFQQPAIYPGDGAQNRFKFHLLVRGVLAPSTVMTLRRAVAGVDPTQPVLDVRTMDELRSQWNGSQRYVTQILGLFAVIGTVLAALGVFALVSNATAARSREFGVRVALGASMRSLQRTLLGWTGALACVGVALGALLAAWQTFVLRELLFGVAPLDALTFIGAAILLVSVALLAAAQAARRVRRLDVIAVLRD